VVIADYMFLKRHLFSQEKPAEGEAFRKKTLDNLKGTVDVNEAVKNADLVVEAIVENMETKHKLFSAIDKVNKLLLIMVISHSWKFFHGLEFG